jgi:hypothetical protein
VFGKWAGTAAGTADTAAGKRKLWSCSRCTRPRHAQQRTRRRRHAPDTLPRLPRPQAVLSDEAVLQRLVRPLSGEEPREADDLVREALAESIQVGWAAGEPGARIYVLDWWQH